MATHKWLGQTAAVAQVTTVTVGGTLSSETFTISVGGVAIASHTDATTVISATVTALVTAWNASTHAYATGITAVAASPNITLTADTAGVPFAVTLNTPGGSATLGQAATTANAGPNVLAAANFDGGALPSNGDTVIFEANSVDVLWSLDAMTARTTLTIIIAPTFTGKIGLDKRVFQTSATATTTARKEYRADRLLTDGATLVWLPAAVTGSPTKSTRILINTQTSVANYIIEDTATTASETDLEPVRLAGSHASSTLVVRGSSVVGIGTTDPADTAQFTTVEISGSAKVNSTSGVTIATLTLRGSPVVRLAKAPTTINGGGEGITATLMAAFAGTVTTMTIGEGMAVRHTGGAATVTTLHQYGLLDLTGSQGTFTVTTYNVLSNDAKITDPFKRIANNTDFVFGGGIVPNSFFELAGGRTLRQTA